MKLWGKTMAELDEDHRRMLADRLARQQNATPQQLGQYYGDMLKPHKPTQQERFDAMVSETTVPCYFGTDIPMPERNTDSTGQYVIPRGPNIPARNWPAIIALSVMAWALVAVAIGIYWALT